MDGYELFLVLYGFLAIILIVFLFAKGGHYGGRSTTVIVEGHPSRDADISPRVDVAGQVQQGMEMAMASFETSHAIAEGFKAPFDALGAVYN